MATTPAATTAIWRRRDGNTLMGNLLPRGNDLFHKAMMLTAKASPQGRRRTYFQLQFGMSVPGPVKALRWVPSASMVQMRIWDCLPLEVLAKTMWRPSGDQEGKSHWP